MQCVLEGPGRPRNGARGPAPRLARSTASLEEGGGRRRQREEAEGGGGRRAERLFVVRFDPEGEPETLTFLA